MNLSCKKFGWLLALLMGSLLSGCAHGASRHPDDPLEAYNRSMSGFNDQVDRAFMQPVASAYQQVTPVLVRTGVGNFFANLGDAWSFVNNTLQLRPEAAATSFFRFSVNSTMGLAGVLDVASEMGMQRYKQDFGLTLGRWGVPTGPYVVLPILGPSTLRDTLALPVDWKGDLVTQVDPVSVRNSLYLLRAVDTRERLLGAGKVLEGAALDKYSFTRDVYLQMRRGASGQGGDQGGALPDDGRLPPEPQ